MDDAARLPALVCSRRWLGLDLAPALAPALTPALALTRFAADAASGWWTWLPELASRQGVPAAHMYLSSIVGRVVASGAFLLATALLRCCLVITPSTFIRPSLFPYFLPSFLTNLLTYRAAQLRRRAHATARLPRSGHWTLGGTVGRGSLGLTLSLTLSLTHPYPYPYPYP